MFVNSDFSDLLKLFYANSVEYMVMGIPGLKFQEAWKRRETVWFDDLAVLFISRQDLIVAKRTSGRPQDLIDADLLSQSYNS